MEYALGGLIGYLVACAVTNLMTMGRMGMFVEKVSLQVLKLIMSAAEDIEFLRALKYKALEDANETATLIRQRNMDDYEFDRWKKAAIDNYLTSFPPVYKKQFVKFSDWDQAVQYFEENRRKL
jgi:hypothetical protein